MKIKRLKEIYNSLVYSIVWIVFVGACSSKPSSVQKVQQKVKAQGVQATRDICFITADQEFLVGTPGYQPSLVEISGYMDSSNGERCSKDVIIPDFLIKFILPGGEKMVSFKEIKLKAQSQGGQLEFEELKEDGPPKIKEFPITSIKDSAFLFRDLKSVTLGGNVEVVGVSAFYGNFIEFLNLGKSVTTIKRYAFANNFLTEVIIPENVIFIGSQAFRENSRLTTVTILNSQAQVAADAFPDGVEVTQGDLTITWPPL